MSENIDNLTDFGPGYEKVAHFYHLFAKDVDLPFFLKYAKLQSSPVLDIAAGSGRVSFALAEAGFDVVAIEKSPAMVSEFKRRLQRASEEVKKRIHLFEVDMTAFSLERKFPLIIIPASFGHARTTDEQLSALACIRNHMTADGLFILDLFPGGIQPEHSTFSEPPVDIPGNRTVTRSGKMWADPVYQILELNLVYTVRAADTGEILDKIEQKSAAALIYNREANLLLRMAGLLIEKEFGDFEETPYSNESGRRILLLRRNL